MTEVVAALIWDKDKFMICQRPKNKKRGLLWEFVGGKVEPGETNDLGKQLQPIGMLQNWCLIQGKAWIFLIW